MKYYHSNVTRLVGDIDNIIKQIIKWLKRKRV